MSATSPAKDFVYRAMDLDGVSVGREDGHLVATRDLADETVDLEDVLDLAREYDLSVANMVVDVPDGETRVVLGGDRA